MVMMLRRRVRRHAQADGKAVRGRHGVLVVVVCRRRLVMVMSTVETALFEIRIHLAAETVYLNIFFSVCDFRPLTRARGKTIFFRPTLRELYYFLIYQQSTVMVIYIYGHIRL
jgi:hypothetical protein